MSTRKKAEKKMTVENDWHQATMSLVLTWWPQRTAEIDKNFLFSAAFVCLALLPPPEMVENWRQTLRKKQSEHDPLVELLSRYLD